MRVAQKNMVAIVEGLEPRLIQQTTSQLITAFQTFLDAAERVIELQPPFGGWLVVRTDENVNAFQCFIGESLEEEVMEDMQIALDNAKRLSLRPAAGRGATSWIIDKVAGAVKGKNHIVSFSGIDSATDEAIALLVAIGMDEIGREDAEAAVMESKNPMWPLMKEVIEGKIND